MKSWSLCRLALLGSLAACSTTAANSPASDAGGLEGGAVPSEASPESAPLDAPIAKDLRASCTTWVSQQRATEIRQLKPASNTQKRDQFLAGGGGLRKVANTYYAMWFPDKWFDSTEKRVMFALHGTGGAPEFEWAEWKDALAEQGFAFVGLNFYLDPPGGVGEATYLEPETIYEHFKALRSEMASPCGVDQIPTTMMGFSRGSVQGMRVLAMDRQQQKIIKGHLANAGGWGLGDAAPPPDLAAIKAKGDTQALAGANLWMYCGEKDRDHGWPMCDEMVAAQNFMQAYGAHVETLYRNPDGEHHSMYATPVAVTAALTYLKGLK